ncbi:efflux RND transporter periplasmic adaptor subunit [Aureimonas jatrophae]|uniref:Membrane fusion protein, multidrug efflux system n=1 Tax=Aureimonas jatrophae TaxID=1166073 RepID=A0A1H0CN58_9HYPH|nr:efflux RND transporter periplasmic adaptor subunit [Aureimonas jatrophae]MBB3949307.1 membrane fusion protein (multidrug efflux system) [Aureimonas jatrophae]SDN59282.1 membrane fusion protein, multidrug efflux system [Aureimonas jatrophae]
MPSSRALLLALPLLASSGWAFAQGAPGGGAAPPPPAVTVETVTPSTVPVTYEYPARVAASRLVEIRAQVGGILLERSFNEGARVNEGDTLFRIDPKPYQAEVALAEAQVTQARAQQSQAQRTEERAQSLARTGATSTATLDDARSQRELADAAVAQAEARLQTAQLSLGYTTVTASAGGITSLEQVPEGSLIQQGALLTQITQLDPIYVNFSPADTEAQSIRQQIESGTAEGSLEDLKVSVRFGNGETYAQTGSIDFLSSSIDTQTGTILSRAVLPNPDSRLLPGQFVRVEVEGLKVPNAVTIPTAALMQGPQGTFVYALDAQNVAAVRPVTVGRELGDRLLVSNGLQGGDRVVTVGVIKVRPGSPVQPTGAVETPAGSSPAGQVPQASAAPASSVAEAQ